jgi:chromosome segregation ATPase
VCYDGGNDVGLFEESSENPSHFGKCKSQSMTAVQDIYEGLQDVRPPYFTGSNFQYYLKVRAADVCHHDGFHGIPDNNLEQETDEKLLQRAKDVDACPMVPPAENNWLNGLRDNKFNSTTMLQLIQGLTEDRNQLASELSSQIKARLTERFAAKEQYRRSKLEIDTRTRRLEKEKTDIQCALERELDRRSNDWSVKLERFQSEEQKLRGRVRELSEQNVSFQREITLLESRKVNVSNRTTGLELQNKQLNNDLHKVKNDHHNLQNSSTEFHDKFIKAEEEGDQIRKYLNDKVEDNKALYKVIAGLQRVLNSTGEGKAALADIIIRSHKIIGPRRENPRTLVSHH